MISSVLVKYVLTAAIRDKLLLSIVAVVVLGVSLSLFMASSAVIEQNQFSIVFTASSLRLLGLAGLVLFIVFFIRRSFDARDIEYLLSRPVSRSKLVLSNAVAFSTLALAAGAMLSMIVGGLAFSNGADLSGVMKWSVGVTAEYIIMANTALFFAMVLSSPVTAGMAVIGFYVLSRMMGELLGVVANPPFHFVGDTALAGIMKAISMLIPRLDLLTQTSWLLYGGGGFTDYVFIFMQAVVFTVLILVASLIDLVRSQF